MKRQFLVGAVALGSGVMLLPLSQGLAAAPSPGERAFQKCYACHSVEEPGEMTMGPSLKGILSRKTASQQGFDYSQAMLAYAERQKKWDRQALDAFLVDPQRVVPGNEMGFFGIRDAAERKVLIDWLAKQ